ncbi:MAG: ABC transporter ATP-binding protein [Myxococcota bacterium]
MIEIEKLTKYYGAHKAVGPLSFAIERGEVIGLLGLNGAGKTTTLRMLSSDLLPTSGQMRVDGIDLVEAPEKVRPQIGYLPDRPPLYGEMTVREYLSFAAKLKRTRGSVRRRVDEVIEMTDAGDYADARIDTLSHGYRQRVGIAQAIVHQPKLLLLDEPISGLDPVQIVEMRALIRSLRGEHTTVVSSHILSEISETCDRLLVIRDGEIVAAGTEDELRAQMVEGEDVPAGTATAGTTTTAGGATSSSSVAASRRLTVVVRPPASTSREEGEAKLSSLVEALAGVTEVRAAEAVGEGKDAVAVAIVADRDVRTALVANLVREDFGVLGLERDRKELESVFLELTKTERRSSAEGAKKAQRGARPAAARKAGERA